MKRWLICSLMAAALLHADTLLVPSLTVLGTNFARRYAIGSEPDGPGYQLCGWCGVR